MIVVCCAKIQTHSNISFLLYFMSKLRNRPFLCTSYDIGEATKLNTRLGSSEDLILGLETRFYKAWSWSW